MIVIIACAIDGVLDWIGIGIELEVVEGDAEADPNGEVRKKTRELNGHGTESIIVPCPRKVLKVSELVVISSSSSIFLAVVEMWDAIESTTNTSNSSEQKRITLATVAVSKRIRANTKWIVVHICIDLVHAIGTADLAGIGAGVGVDGV